VASRSKTTEKNLQHSQIRGFCKEGPVKERSESKSALEGVTAPLVLQGKKEDAHQGRGNLCGTSELGDNHKGLEKRGVQVQEKHECGVRGRPGCFQEVPKRRIGTRKPAL